MNMLYIISKARGMEISNIYNYFREIVKFRENMSKTDFAKFLKVFIKSRNLIFLESNYIFEISRPRALK